MTLDYGNFGIFLVMGNAGFISSTIAQNSARQWQWDPVSKPNALPTKTTVES